jgi:hypothetical protein
MSLFKTQSKLTLEAIALDADTGLYNFYNFTFVDQKPTTLERFIRDEKGDVTRVSFDGAKVAEAPSSVGKACFGCHIGGSPIMNPLREPWTNWFSTRKTKQASQASDLNDTASALIKAALSFDDDKLSLANDLEQIIRPAIETWAHGHKSDTGYVHAVLNPPQSSTFKKKDGLKELFRSVFCETTLNFASSSDRVPLELFADPDIVLPKALVDPMEAVYKKEDSILASGEEEKIEAFEVDRKAADLVIEAPRVVAEEPEFPLAIPVRAEQDRAVERALISRGYLTNEMALAIRLLDDEHDVFSKARCGVLDQITAETLAKEPADFKSALHTLLTGIATKGLEHASTDRRLKYMKAVLAADNTVTAMAKDYFTARKAAVAEKAKLLASAEGLKTLEAEIDARRKDAFAFFNTEPRKVNGGPIPEPGLPEKEEEKVVAVVLPKVVHPLPEAVDEHPKDKATAKLSSCHFSLTDPRAPFEITLQLEKSVAGKLAKALEKGSVKGKLDDKIDFVVTPHIKLGKLTSQAVIDTTVDKAHQDELLGKIGKAMKVTFAGIQ